MRTIKFRGKRVDNGEWIYGDLMTYDNDYVICDVDDGGYLPIVRETVGQFTGLYDNTQWGDLSEQERQEFYFKNCSDDGVTIKYKTQEEVKHLWKGREIYEGDIVSAYKDLTEMYSRGSVENGTLEVWEEVFGTIDIPKGIVEYVGSSFRIGEYYLDTIEDCELEVIGNIHDNKETL